MAKSDSKASEKVQYVPFTKLYKYATGLDLAMMILGGTCAAAAGAALPGVSIVFGGMVNVLTDFQLGKVSPAVFMENISYYALVFVYLGLAVMVCTYVFMSTWIFVGERMGHRMREEYLKAVLHMEIKWFDTLGAGEITTRITTDTTLFQDGAGEKVASLIQDMATFVSGLIIAFTAEWRLALAVCSILPIMAICSTFINIFAGRFTTRGLNLYAAGGTLAEEAFGSIRTAMAFNQQSKLSKMYNSLMNQAEQQGRKRSITVGVCAGIIFLTIYCGYAIAFYYGGQLIHWNLVTSGKVVNVFFSILIGATSIANIPPHLQAITYARGAAAKLFEAIELKPSIDAQSEFGQKLVDIKGELEFRNINFNYPSRPDVKIFDNFSLKIEPGTTVALVGASGSGKSTTIQLLERFYDPTSGEVTLDGKPINNLHLKWYRQQLGLVSQEPTLFSGTIAENVAIGLIGTPLEHGPQEKRMEQIIEACKQANAHQFITGLPLSYDTQVGEKGFLLSGGQKQRIAIARAIVKDPRILLLDEATSALDTKSELVVQEALDRASQGRTTIVIAHRLSTIKNADRIVVMERGRVVEMGSHEELMRLEDGAYKKLVEIQSIRSKATDAKVASSVEKLVASASAVEDEGFTEVLVEEPNGKNQIVKITTKSTQNSTITNIEEGVTSEFKTSLFSLIIEICKLNRPETPYILLGTLGATVLGLIYPVFAILFASILQAFSETGDRLLSETSYWALMFFILALCAGVAQLFTQVGFGIASEKLSTRIRSQSFESILWQEAGWFDREANSTGSLVSSLSQDAQDIQGLSGMTFGSILNIVINLISSMIVGLVYSWKVALVVIACLPALLYSGYLRIAMIRNFQKENKKSYSKSAEMACENAGAIRTVAALTKENMVLELYSQAIAVPLKAGYRNAFLSSIAYAVSMSCSYFVNALVFWYGGSLVSTGELTLQRLFTVFMALIVGASGASRVFAFAPDMSKARDAAATIFYLLKREPHVNSKDEGPGKRLEGPKPIKGSIAFENIKFSYPTRPGAEVLKGINFTVQPGQFVALVGPSGCGKSTAIGLLERFYDVSKGKVTIDGVDVRDYHLPSYRDNLALVGQEPALYDLTIRENIQFGGRTYGPAPSASEVEAAAKAANIHDFIMTLPQGYETRVGGKGSQLSGGQKQRIAIARALVRNPTILLLDEATSALDAESEKVVQAALDTAAKGRTTIAIAHRLSTIQSADVILVLKDGHIVERGTHDELVGLKGVYYDMVQRQILDREQ